MLTGSLHLSFSSTRPHSSPTRFPIIPNDQEPGTLLLHKSKLTDCNTDHYTRLLLGKPDMDPNELQTDGRYNHTVQVQERLNFLRY